MDDYCFRYVVTDFRENRFIAVFNRTKKKRKNGCLCKITLSIRRRLESKNQKKRYVCFVSEHFKRRARKRTYSAPTNAIEFQARFSNNSKCPGRAVRKLARVLNAETDSRSADEHGFTAKGFREDVK